MAENQQVLLHFGLQGSERRGHKKKWKQEMEKARENINRTKPEWFLVQSHTPEGKHRNTAETFPTLEQPLPSRLGEWLSQQP